MIRSEDPKGNWFSAHLFRYPHMAVGKTADDVHDAYKEAVKEGTALDKLAWGALPLWSKVGQSVTDIKPEYLKSREIGAYISTVAPLAGGFMFLRAAAGMFQEAGGLTFDAALVGIIGLLGVSIAPYINFQMGRAFHHMHEWMTNQGLDSAYFGVSTVVSGG